MYVYIYIYIRVNILDLHVRLSLFSVTVVTITFLPAVDVRINTAKIQQKNDYYRNTVIRRGYSLVFKKTGDIDLIFYFVCV